MVEFLNIKGAVMSDKIYKYSLEIVDEQIIKLPREAIRSRILFVINQNDKIVLYALVPDTNTESENVSIRIVGTGHNIDFFIPAPMFGGGYTFLGTVSLHSGKLVFHVFYQNEVGEL